MQSVFRKGRSVRLFNCFGEIASTRMACAEAVNNQEQRYLRALEEAERFGLDEPPLLIYTSTSDHPLRFIRSDE